MSEKSPTILFRLDARSSVAPYRQLVDQITHAVQVGRLHDGDQLPSVREVVTQVTINPNTVHRAYRELEHLGLAEGRPGLGTFITSGATVHASRPERAEFTRQLQQVIKRAKSAGLDDEEIFEILGRVLSRDEQVTS